jgi:hypothetical protein
LSVNSSLSDKDGWYSKIAPGAMPAGGRKGPGTWLWEGVGGMGGVHWGAAVGCCC